MAEQSDHVEAAAANGSTRCPCCGNEMDEAQRHAAYLWFRKRRIRLALAGLILIAVGVILLIVTIATGLALHPAFMLMLGLANGMLAGIVVFVPDQLRHSPARQQPAGGSAVSRGDEAGSRPPT